MGFRTPKYFDMNLDKPYCDSLTHGNQAPPPPLPPSLPPSITQANHKYVIRQEQLQWCIECLTSTVSTIIRGKLLIGQKKTVQGTTAH